MPTINDLPGELLLDIFKRLQWHDTYIQSGPKPWPSLARVAGVCGKWFDMTFELWSNEMSPIYVAMGWAFETGGLHKYWAKLVVERRKNNPEVLEVPDMRYLLYHHFLRAQQMLSLTQHLMPEDQASLGLTVSFSINQTIIY